ncbi:protein ecdysoneless homolog isoform X2 [Apium graveolens]|uniref:protein ecdysoneless homolog isoform X2 n=1 Tax=Apium graveolens TaxID=4045 RepID=UPI003D7A5AF0
MAEPSSSPSIFPQNISTRPPDDTVFFSIYPDSSLSPNPNSLSLLQSLHLEILNFISPYTSNYIYQHHPFSLSLNSSDPIPHLHGKLKYGDNLDDEWFVVFLLFEISKRFSSVSIRVFDTDGEFLLIEAAVHLPKWLNPSTSVNRVFIRGGGLCIVPKSRFNSCPNLREALRFLQDCGESVCRVEENVGECIRSRIKGFVERVDYNMHRVRVRVPVTVASVLRNEPCLIALAVEGFYDRDIDSMKYAGKMERFLPNGSGEEFVVVSVKMSRAMYAQLVQQNFQAPKCYPMPSRSEGRVYSEAELGMKIACGFEMIYQCRKRDGEEGKGSTWEAFKASLERSGYFKGLLPGSKEYRSLMENAEEYYGKSSLHSRASDMMSAPVRRIDEILSTPCSPNDFKDGELPPSDDDSWLYNGEEELSAALLEREKEMGMFSSKDKKKQKSKEQQNAGMSSGEDYGLGDIANSMKAFVSKMSSYEGAEVPENRNLEDVDFDVERFMKDIESVMKLPRSDDADSDVAAEEGSSSDMDFGLSNLGRICFLQDFGIGIGNAKQKAFFMDGCI